jgi:outer membrane protein OmpA-like peptidoglycan-associated protein
MYNMTQNRGIVLILMSLLLLMTVSCSVNPFRTDNDLTGSATGTAIGAVAGGGVAALAGASKTEIALAGIVGGLAGYYVTTLDFASGGVTHVGGQVYTLGDYATIEIPSDRLFDVNTSDFLPEANPILDSVLSILNRYPNSNIMVSGNTTGFYTDKFERKLSEDRARQVAAYLWAHGINNFMDAGSNVGGMNGDNSYRRRLRYVGYGSYFPISSTLTAEGLRENNRIQITVYPKRDQLHLNKCGRVFSNIGSVEDTTNNSTRVSNEFSDSTRLPEGPPISNDPSIEDIKGEMSDSYK